MTSIGTMLAAMRRTPNTIGVGMHQPFSGPDISPDQYQLYRPGLLYHYCFHKFCLGQSVAVFEHLCGIKPTFMDGMRRLVGFARAVSATPEPPSRGTEEGLDLKSQSRT